MKSILSITTRATGLILGLATGLLFMSISARAMAANQCSSLFQVEQPESSKSQRTPEIEQTVRLFETYPRYVLRSSTTSDQILLMTELASISKRTQENIAEVIASVPNVTFSRTTSYETRLRIATLSVLSDKSVDDTIGMMSSLPYRIRNFVMNSESAVPIVNLAAVTGRSPVEIVKIVEAIPDRTFGGSTSWSFRLWLAKIQALSNHQSYAETEALIRSAPTRIINRRISPDTLTTIIELAAVTGRTPADIVKTIETVPTIMWGHSTSFETRMWIAKLAILSGRTSLEIETIGNVFPRFVMGHASTIAEKRFLMSVNAVGQNKKAYEMIDRPRTPDEQPIGFWESLSRYLFE